MRPTHSRKARRTGRCPLCSGPIEIGQRVVKVGRRGSWIHRSCFSDRYGQPPGRTGP